MEIALLIVLIVIVFVKFNGLSEQLKWLEHTVTDLKNTVEQLKTQPLPPSVQADKTVVPFKEMVVVPKPIIVEVPELRVIDTEPVTKPIAPVATIPEPIVEVEPEVTRQSWWAKFREQNPDLEQFIGENLISKIGVLILVLGISYFVKYAIDKNWINETARVGIGVLCGAVVMGFAHRLRANYTAFSSVLVAGAVAIFYFTVAIAFHQYHIFSQTVAFVLMVIITAFSVLISVSYNRMELAILSLIGGFTVPFMVSTGSGNYQVLFGYIAILDLGILVIAYYKRWNLVNVLAFVFTSVLYGGWLFSQIIDEIQPPYLGAFVFATIFYLIFSLANIINNLRTQGLFSKIELSVLVANSAVYFSAGMFILSHFHPELKGLFCISLAVFNFVYASVLYKKFGLDKRAIYLLIGLTLTFVTLSIPIQFNGSSITLFWAAEAVLLLWLSQRSQITQFRFTAIVVHVLMLLSLVMDWRKTYNTSVDIAPIMLNSAFIAGICATVSLFFISYLLKNETKTQSLFGISINPTKHRKTLDIGTIAVLYLTGLFEVHYQSVQYFTSSNSAASLPAAYHLVFCAVLVYFLKKSQNMLFQKLATGLSLLNILLYVLLFSKIPLDELQENIILITASTIAFWLHYVSLACVVFFGVMVWQDTKTADSLALADKKWFGWIAAAAVVFVASNEVLLHGLQFLTEPILANSTKAYSQGTDIYDKAQTVLVKAAFPILWGGVAFVFLTIGIKNQWQNLRIIALTLLGLTIVKLFVYDISNVSETGKIIAFILLGVLILVMSFAYQKIKKIVLKDDKNDN